MGNTQPRAPQYLGWGFAGLHWIELLPLSSPPSLFFTGADPNKHLAPQIPSQYLWQRTQPVTVGYEELEGLHRWGGRGGVRLWQTKETQYGSSGKLKWHYSTTLDSSVSNNNYDRWKLLLHAQLRPNLIREAIPSSLIPRPRDNLIWSSHLEARLLSENANACWILHRNPCRYQDLPNYLNVSHGSIFQLPLNVQWKTKWHVLELRVF